jgi:hypothetical protein
MKQRPKLHVVTDLARQQRAFNVVQTSTGLVPSMHIDRNRITLPGLRFMGEEPHPAQLFEREPEE